MIDIVNKYNIGKKKLIGIGIFVILFLIALPLTLIQVQKQQEVRQRAQGISVAHLSFSSFTRTVEDEIYTILTLFNPNNKNISGVDITFTYDNSIFEVTGFSSATNMLTKIVSEKSAPGEFHYVGVNSSQEQLIDSSINLGTLILQENNRNGGTINFSNVVITAVGDPQPLAINPADNKPAVYNIEQATQTSEPSPIPSTALISPTSTNSAVSPTVPPGVACQAPQTVSCGRVYGNVNNTISWIPTSSWVPVDGVTSYRLEWCYPNANFSDSDFKNRDCGFILASNPEAYILFPDRAKNPDYKVRVRSEASSSCHPQPGEWSEIKSCLAITSTPTPTPIPAPPFISDIGIDPNMGQVGTKFLVFSRVTSKGSLKSVKATVRYQGSIIYEDTIQLYDDGTHGDIEAGDGYYMNVWDSNKKGLPKETTIAAKDADENISSLSKVFDLTEEVCREAVPGHNDKNANRVNVVFTGANYGNTESFSKDVTEALDFSGTEGGLFSQEPFRSNRDKFNFWYSNRVGNSLRSCDITHVNVFDIIKCRAEINISASSCVVSNKTIIGLVNLDAHGAFAFGTTAYIPTIGVRRALSGSNHNPIGKIVLHEFGHSFGRLTDEYVGSNVLELFPLDRILGEGKTIDFRNIFKGTQEKCFSPKNPWYDLIGRGCGVDNKIDCVENYDSKNDTITCADGVNKLACWAEVGCFRGARSPDNFRSTFANIMNGTKSYNAFDLKSFFRIYGPVNERELCKKIKEKTGSTGGICTTDYGIR